MSGESTTPELVELARRQFEAVNRHDLDAVMSCCTPDVVYDTSPDAMGLYEGPAAIGALLGGWWDAFVEHALEPEEVRRTRVYTDIDEGRAAAERLAEERG